MSSRQPLASLSTRTGRRRSRVKLRLQSGCVCGAVTTGAVMMTSVVALAVCPRSSTRLQVTVMVIGLKPAVVRTAVGPELPITPAVALYEYVTGRFCGLMPTVLMAMSVPETAVLGLALQVSVGAWKAMTLKGAAHDACWRGLGPSSTCPVTT